jgi:hypothetical protein
MRPQHRKAHEEIARIAGAAKGVVTHEELIGLGLSRSAIQRRIRSGSLIAQYRGVYRVGHAAPSVGASYMAAVKACGAQAVLTGCAAGYWLGLLRGSPPEAEVTSPTERRVPGVSVRRRQLHSRDIATSRGIPVTTVPATLVDLAATLDDDALMRACHEAGVRYRTTPRHVAEVLRRRPKARGAARLRRILTGETRITLSVLERRFLELLRANNLPLPVTNREKGGRRIDCRWPDHRLTVELVSYTFHPSRYAFEQDHRRAREARARGDEFRSYTWGDVFEHPAPMLTELRELLVPGAAG